MNMIDAVADVSASGWWGKRALDVAGATALLIVTAPLWMVLAAAVRLTSRGPILYRGRRIGKDGRPFSMYKLRSMRIDADRIGPAVTGTNDPRVTPVGRFLRATKFDELPQLLNVLRGEMSLVGPRPEAPEYVATYDARQRRVLSVCPGITGPTQLAYRHEERLLPLQDIDHLYRTQILPRKLEMDLAYVANRTFWRDLVFLWTTLGRLVLP